MSRRSILYIDGFNLYYGAVKGSPYKWLNIQRMCERLRQDDEIQLIRYFTALVNGPTRANQERSPTATAAASASRASGETAHLCLLRAGEIQAEQIGQHALVDLRAVCGEGGGRRGAVSGRWEDYSVYPSWLKFRVKKRWLKVPENPRFRGRES